MNNPYFPLRKLLLLAGWLLATTALLPAQPVLLKDLAPGTDSSNAYGFTNVNGTVFFATRTGVNATLWKTNGTAAGTVALKNFVGDQFAFGVNNLTQAGSLLYFTANDGSTGNELWKSDGTPGGTVVVKDLEPGFFTLGGVNYPNSSEPTDLADVNGTLYFKVNVVGGAYGSPALYKTDGSPGGTVLVKEAFRGSNLTALNGVLYYTTRTDDGLWLGKSDGTTAGTVLVQAIVSTDDGFYSNYQVHFMENVNGTLYFGLSYFYRIPQSGIYQDLELWRSNGTAGGTGYVGKLVEQTWEYDFLYDYVFVGNSLYFTYFDESEYTLLKSSLTAQVEEIGYLGPGAYSGEPGSGGSPFSTGLANVHGTLYLAAIPDENYGRELYRSNGSAGNLQLVADLKPGPPGSNPEDLVAANGLVYFGADDGTHGQEPFRYDAMVCGTPTALFSVTGSTVCKGQPATVSVSGAKAGTTYKLYLNNILKGQVQASGSTFAFTVATDTLAPTNHLFTVRASLCPLLPLAQTAVVTVQPASGSAGPQVLGTTIYNGQKATLSVQEPLPNVTYRWYAQATGGTALATGVTYVTPVLAATTTYYASAAGGASCGESSRTPVVVQVIPKPTVTSFAPAAIKAPDTVIVTGKTFVGVTAVQVGGVPARFTVLDAQTLRIIVAEHTPTGTIAVTTPAGTGTSTAPLTVTTPFAIRINAGDKRYVAADGRVFAADSYFSGGKPSTRSIFMLDDTEDDSLYQQGRYGAYFTYNLPTGNGNFSVILHFHETYWDWSDGDDARRFHVDVEGTRRLTNYSIRAAVNRYGQSVREALKATVTDGVLNLVFSKGSADLALVSAIEVVPDPEPAAFRINAGGSGWRTANGKLFQSDQYYAGGAVSDESDDDYIFGTNDWPLYRRSRYGSTFSYAIPAGNGTFDVTLHFNEPTWGWDGDGVGKRKFNVDAEGVRRLTEYDIYAKAGAANTAVREKFTVTVTDGVLNLLFTKGSAELALVSAIEVVPAVNAWRINAGGPAYTGSGKTFAGDAFFSGGRLATPVTGAIANTTDDPLYFNGRTGGVFGYNLPTGKGTYTVTLHFAETWWGNGRPGGVGSRRFHVNAEGVRRLTEYDIYAKAGGPMRAVRETFTVQVTDDTLNIAFLKGSADQPRVEAIEVVRTPAGARLAVTAPEGTDGVTLYPNPVTDRLYVRLTVPAAEVSATAITATGGQTLRQNPHRVVGTHELEIRVDDLRSGLYLLHLQTGQGRRVVRFAKQ